MMNGKSGKNELDQLCKTVISGAIKSVVKEYLVRDMEENMERTSCIEGVKNIRPER